MLKPSIIIALSLTTASFLSISATASPKHGVQANAKTAIAKHDFINKHKQRFMLKDKNKNGLIDKQELRGSKKRFRRLARRIDKDNNKSISRSEHLKWVEKRFARMDINKDGKLSNREIRRARKIRHIAKHHRKCFH